MLPNLTTQWYVYIDLRNNITVPLKAIYHRLPVAILRRYKTRIILSYEDKLYCFLKRALVLLSLTISICSKLYLHYFILVMNTIF